MSFFKNTLSPSNPDKEIETKLFRALYKSDKSQLIKLVENNNIDLNNFVFSNSDTVLINATDCSSEFRNSNQQIDLINYLIDNDIDVNRKNQYGYNALHIALECYDLCRASLVLIQTGKININEAEEKNGNPPIFTAIRGYGKMWRLEQKELSKCRLEIIEELLKRGADLNQLNNHGVSSKRWIEISDDKKLHTLIEKYDRN